jgi:hypothetical protein
MYPQLHAPLPTDSSGVPAAWGQLLPLDLDSILSVPGSYVEPWVFCLLGPF